MSDLLKDKVAIITGAAHPKGIGRAIAKAFIENGANVVVADLALSEGMDTAAQELSAEGRTLAIACDVTDHKAIKQCIDTTLETFGRFDVLVNNAGVGVGSDDFLELSDRDWELSFNINVKGVANFCQAAIPHFKESGGVIINNASLAGLGAMPSLPASYTATKFAAIGLTKQIAQQYAKDGIRCNALCPGSVVTQLHEKSLQLIASENNISIEEAQAMEDSNIPMGYSAQPSEIGKAAVYLASDLSSYITGVALPVAGGMAPGL